MSILLSTCRASMSVRSLVVSSCKRGQRENASMDEMSYSTLQGRPKTTSLSRQPPLSSFTAFVCRCVALLCIQSGRNLRIGNCNGEHLLEMCSPSSHSPSASPTSFSSPQNPASTSISRITPSLVRSSSLDKHLVCSVSVFNCYLDRASERKKRLGTQVHFLILWTLQRHGREGLWMIVRIHSLLTGCWNLGWESRRTNP